MLENIRIASPCSANWELMQGDDQVRFCGECKKNVYNLSSMTRAEAERLLSIQQSICTRFYRRADGTILTEDCPVGLRAKAARVRRRVSFAISGAFGLATLCGQNALPQGVRMAVEASLQPELVGTVSDITGARIVNATVTVTDLETHKVTILRTSAGGNFRMPANDEASYALKIESTGFQSTIIPKVYIVPKYRRMVDVTLQIGAMMGEVVNVAPAK